jgi:hypothetical protein
VSAVSFGLVFESTEQAVGLEDDAAAVGRFPRAMAEAATTVGHAGGPLLTRLSAMQPLLIAANVRLAHRHDSSAAVSQWLHTVAAVRLDSPASAAPPRGREGELVLGVLHPPKHRADGAVSPPRPLRVRDHRGELHFLRAGDEPLRVLAVLATRESATHCCGGLLSSQDPDSDAGLPVPSGLRISWLGDEGGLVGQVVSDAPEQLVLGMRDASSNPEEGQLHYASQACDFDVISLVFDLSTGLPLHIRSLSPPIPRSLTVVDPASPLSSVAAIAAAAAALPKLLLVASTSSSLGKTTLAARIILALHDLALDPPALPRTEQNGTAGGATITAPRIAYVKLTGSGGCEDLVRIRALKNAHGQPAVALAYDHVDVGLATTYSSSAGSGGGGGGSGSNGNSNNSMEHFKAGINDLLALASAPCTVPPVASVTLPHARTRRHDSASAGSTVPSSSSSSSASSSSTSSSSLAVPVYPAATATPSPAHAHARLAPPDLVVCELGSDLIWANNPVVLSMSAVQSRLMGVCLLTTDALAILGASSYMHGTLRFPPDKLHLFAAHRSNYAGLEARVHGSDVRLHRADDEQALRKLLRTVLRDNNVNLAHSSSSSTMHSPLPAAAAPSIASAVTPITTAPNPQLHQQPSAPPSQQAMSENGTPLPAPTAAPVASVSAYSNSTNTTWPASSVSFPHPVLPDSRLQSPPSVVSAVPPVSSTPRLLAAAAEALAWAERSYVPVALPPSPNIALAHRPELSQLWQDLVEWSLQCTFLLSSAMHSSVNAGQSVAAAAQTAHSHQIPLSWDESAVGAVVLCVSRSERLGRALAFLWLQRRRDKLRALQQRAEGEQRKSLMENSLGMLAGAKSAVKKPAAAAAAVATTTPVSSNHSSSHAAGHISSHASLLLSLPDYVSSPYALAAVPLAPPESVPSALLSVDSSLASLRHACVPARVTEETFWNTYFAHVQDELQAYLTHARRAQQLTTQQ